ncbi:hypothetical protein [Paraburkholderia diazotrophica]|uniref:Uncharacterized protein n=1 Tax=Paraburkholderia diazotrophica TaxID=667676 RepID=A0A1H6QQC9_9BURK|nr:hypothetical protein [Paraburkholderia diazotrophica]SEI41660.1 hypothetical protein SAMN05192539_1001269 [Paraburkholderia diazotrophica]
MADVKQLPVQGATSRPAPRRIMRPCEYGLWGTMRDLETQLGTVEAYNRLCDAAAALKAKIDSGNAQAQHKMWATDPNFIYPAGHHD